MASELDHVFICVSRGAPEAEHLVQFGLREGQSNTHPGQGTANRRFFFRNAMLELLWVEDPREAQSEGTAVTRLWERWSNRQSGACPFGIVLRPTATGNAVTPFPAQGYRPRWLPPDLQIYIAPAAVQEPMWVFMPFLRRVHHEQRFTGHPNGACEITRLILTAPTPWTSQAASVVASTGLGYRDGPEYLLNIEFDGALHHERINFLPDLPLVLQL
jgi:hypothetical protein